LGQELASGACRALRQGTQASLSERGGTSWQARASVSRGPLPFSCHWLETEEAIREANGRHA